MKKHLAIVAAAALLFTGCTTLNPVTGEREFDQAKTAAALAPMETAIAGAVKFAAEADVNSGVGLRIAEQVITNLLATEGSIPRDTIMARIMEIEIDGMSPQQQSDLKVLLGNLILDNYDILVAYVFRQGLSPDSQEDAVIVTRMALETVRDGINLGLQVARAPGE